MRVSCASLVAEPCGTTDRQRLLDQVGRVGGFEFSNRDDGAFVEGKDDDFSPSFRQFDDFHPGITVFENHLTTGVTTMPGLPV